MLNRGHSEKPVNFWEAMLAHFARLRAYVAAGEPASTPLPRSSRPLDSALIGSGIAKTALSRAPSGRSASLQPDPQPRPAPSVRQGRRQRDKTPIQRREPRYSAPFLDVIIHVELIVAGQRHAGRLWDISCSGACVRSFTMIPVGGTALLRFHEPSAREIVEARVRLIWCNEVRGMTYLGMRFVDPVDFGRTFLRTLMRDSLPGADRV